MNISHKFLKPQAAIKEWLWAQKITRYRLLTDQRYGFVVNVGQDISLKNKNLGYIPVKFNKISGLLDVSGNSLTSLEFCPETVPGNFNCSYNALKTLRYAPFRVGGDFVCAHNTLTSLEYCPKETGNYFDCQSNQLTSLQYMPRNINGSLNCFGNQLLSLKFSPQRIKGSFYGSANRLTTLEHCPQVVEGDFFCDINKIQNLEFIPQKMGGRISLRENPALGELQTIETYKDLYAAHQELLAVLEEKRHFEKVLSSSIYSSGPEKLAKSHSVPAMEVPVRRKPMKI